MGYKQVIGGVFTDPTLPILRPDALMSDGTLFLIDFGRGETAPTGSVPAHNALLTNLAWETAADVIGGGTESSLAGVFENTLVGQPTMGLVERSSKFGLAVIASQVGNDTSNRHAGVALPSDIVSYILTQTPGHAFYVSVWGRLTRSATASIDSIGYLGSTVNANNHAFVLYKQPAFSPSSGSAFVGGRSVPNSLSTGNFFRNVAFDEFTGTESSLGSTSGAFWLGQRGIFSSLQRNGASSGIIYRIFIEDLNVSGRSYATLDAADKAAFDLAFASGGRFYNDTFTNPETLP
jgi:hypothetical protein